ncbi:hypothetical protein CDCA_CDCA07G2207 [Cyanidium caldarium]|uniref:Nudix hydrolase domain-containing protein n=1 Tax=Cyanidium caldarium TaxID=2771 RepID=A0AAV9IV94_CYACA|nr:hypothetical protein CDCA_CDCA07G2207 [Cyanidium caldarium]
MTWNGSPERIKRYTLFIGYHWNSPDGECILLGWKKRGFGQGKWNGFGGKIEAGESAPVAAQRELVEEAGVHCVDGERHSGEQSVCTRIEREARSLRYAGVLRFRFDRDGAAPMDVLLFSGTICPCRAPRESDEMRPQWFRRTEIPYAHMWPDDRIWLPQLLQADDQIYRSPTYGRVLSSSTASTAATFLYASFRYDRDAERILEHRVEHGDPPDPLSIE